MVPLPRTLASLRLHSFAANRIWCTVAALAAEITAWMQMLALAGHEARRWAPKTLGFRLYTIPANLARSGRRVRLPLAARPPLAHIVLTALVRLGALAPD